jgi:prepilin-type N-terminal cleavage/methylation domain-containing protein
VRRLRLPADGDRGTTLVELVVTMVIFAVLMSSVATLTLGINRTDRGTVARVDRTADAWIALRTMSRAISRAVVPTALGGSSSSAVVTAGPTTLTFFAYLDDPDDTRGPTRVEYAVVDGVLTQTLRLPKDGTRDTYCTDADTSTACAGRVSTTVLGREVRCSAADPLFVYRDAAGEVTTTPAQVRSVDVALVLGTAGLGSTTRLVDHLALDNL